MTLEASPSLALQASFRRLQSDCSPDCRLGPSWFQPGGNFPGQEFGHDSAVVAAVVSFENLLGIPGKLYQSGVEQTIFGFEIARHDESDVAGAWAVVTVHGAKVLRSPAQDHVIFAGVERNDPKIRGAQG